MNSWESDRFWIKHAQNWEDVFAECEDYEFMLDALAPRGIEQVSRDLEQEERIKKDHIDVNRE